MKEVQENAHKAGYSSNQEKILGLLII